MGCSSDVLRSASTVTGPPRTGPGRECRTHYMTNPMAVTPRSWWPWVRTLDSVFDHLYTESIAAQYDRIIDVLSDKPPEVADHLKSDRGDLLAFSAFPKQIWSNSPQERLNKGSRRTDVVGIFPDRDVLVRLVGVVVAEQHDGRAESRRYLGIDVLTKSRAVNDTPTEQESAPAAPTTWTTTLKNYTTSYARSLDLNRPETGTELCRFFWKRRRQRSRRAELSSQRALGLGVFLLDWRGGGFECLRRRLERIG